MKFPIYIAKRYLISRKSHNIINIISGISVLGITVGTMALVIILSVFNGFEKLVISLFNVFNPDLKIELAEGKTFSLAELPADSIRSMPEVIYFTEVVEENALLRNDERQHIVRVKGVSDDFREMSGLDSMLVDGHFVLEANGQDFAVLGAGVAYFLDIGLGKVPNTLSVYVPSRTRSPGLSFESAFNQRNVIPAGIFSVQQDFDSEYVILPLDFVRDLLEYEDQLTALEIGLKDGADIQSVQESIQKLAGDKFEVKNRFQQQELLYKIMRSEKWVSFLILTFILVIATFNLIGSISMLILDKKKDIAVLHSMGADNRLIRKIFMAEGLMISWFGGFLGLLLGTLIVLLQQYFGLIRLGAPGGTFVVEYYPVVLQITDLIYVFLTVSVIGLLSTWFPVKQISRKYLDQKLA